MHSRDANLKVLGHRQSQSEAKLVMQGYTLGKVVAFTVRGQIMRTKEATMHTQPAVHQCTQPAGQQCTHKAVLAGHWLPSVTAN